MKKVMCTIVLILLSVAMNSCAADVADAVENGGSTGKLITDYEYNTSELETLKLINEYRVSIGLNALETINHISYKCEEHNLYMIENNVVNHNDFTARSNNIISVLGATKVGENVAYNFQTSEAVVKAWLESPDHKVNIEGDFTHFGIAVTTDAEGRKYYTNIFAKI